MSDLEQELIEAEREGWQALASGRGGEHYRQHLAANAVMAFPFGVMSRQEAIDAMETAPPWSSFELVDPQIVELSADSGIVVYRVNAQRVGEEPYSAIVSRAFVRGDGRWHWHSTSSRAADIYAASASCACGESPEVVVTWIVALPASKSIPSGVPSPGDGLTTSIML
jgi:hypothetical protein